MVAGACESTGLTSPAVAPSARPDAVAAALQGRLPGVQVTSHVGSGVRIGCNPGDPDAKGREPLYVVDGVPTTQAEMVAMELAVEQIADIYVMKAAVAAQMYGERARDGAVVITTRRL